MLKPIMRLITALLFVLSFQCNLVAAAEESVTRPVIAESISPLLKISPVASDGHAGLSFVRKPPGDGPFPAVLLVHGGAEGWDEAAIHDYALYIHASRFLAEGYVVASVTRRDLDMTMPVEQQAVIDVLAVYDWIAAQPYVDAQSIVVRGTSVGGYLTLEVAAARTPAAILVEEPFSFPFVNISLGATDQSPDTSKLEKITSPILLIRGDQTANLNDFNRRVLIPALGQADKRIDVMTYPGGLHSFAFYDNAERTPQPVMSLRAFNLMDDFFRLHLKTAPVPMRADQVSWEAVQY